MSFLREIAAGREEPVFLLASALDPVQEILVVANDLTRSFLAALTPIAKQAGASVVPVSVPQGVPGDLWMQDSVETGCDVSCVGEELRWEPAVLAGLRSKHQGVNAAPLDAHLRDHFRGRGFHVHELGEPRCTPDWIDWYGNLEVSPPVTAADGRAFPVGRAMVGRQRGLTMHSGVLEFLERQGVQVPPLFVDTSWLQIGHVDEVVSFVPSRESPGFRALVPDPRRAVEILERLVLGRHERTLVFEGHSDGTTVTGLLDEVGKSEETRAIVASLEETRGVLCRELGLREEHLIGLPVLFRAGAAVIPNCVNGLICNGHAILPSPCGPVVEGEDAFAAVVRRELEAHGVVVHFLDVWDFFHCCGGEIHCGTNTVRVPRGAGGLAA